jgi:hypothetical protein
MLWITAFRGIRFREPPLTGFKPPLAEMGVTRGGGEPML